MRHKISASHARAFTRHLDRMANLIEKEAKSFGVPTNLYKDLAFRMDYVADLVSKNANLLTDRSPKNPGQMGQPGRGGFDAGTVGETNSGPSIHLDTDENWMDDQFTQQEFSELRTRVEKDMLENTHEMDRMASPRGSSNSRRAQWEQRRASLLRQARMNVRAGEEVVEEVEEEDDAPKTSKEAQLRQRENRLLARENDLLKREAAFRRKMNFNR